MNKNLYINYLDVNQGDSTIIIYNNKSILIDTGGYKYKNIFLNIKSFIFSKGISKINYLIITHGDYDHMGEAINLVNNIKIENVIFNCSSYNELEQELIKVLEKKDIKYYSCIKEINIDKYKMQFLNTKEYDNENDNSNVIYFKYHNYKFLFMGDAGAMLLGYLMSSVSLIGVAPSKSAMPFSTIVPVMVLALPIFDTSFAIVKSKFLALASNLKAEETCVLP